MAKPTASPILQRIRRVADDLRVRELPDHELLQQFHTQRDQAAFHVLLRRHGPMVLDVCRSVLTNEADTEDAFQATFLVLARKAGSIRKAASLASWLHGVAYRSAIKARAQSRTRQKHEARVPARPASAPDDLSWREVRAVLHEELNKLSEHYRVPLVLCYLHGKTQEQAADQLGLAKSTLRERVARGRDVLRARLVRRGLGPAALLVAAAWPATTASASVPLSLMVFTPKAAGVFAAGSAAAAAGVSANAAAIAKGVLQSMLFSKLKLVTGMLFVLTGLVIGGVSLAPGGGQQPRPAPPAAAAAPKDDIPPWMKEFRKIYSLADGEVLKRISKFPECRLEYIRNSERLAPGTDTIPINMALRVHQKETKGQLHLWGFGGGDMSISTAMLQIGIPMGEVEAEGKLLGTPIGGDIVFRQDVPVEKLVPALERILRDECKLPVKLTFKEVERDVVVARGALKVVPLAGQEKNHIEVFAKEIGKGEYWCTKKDLHGFLLDLGGFLGRRFVNEAKSGQDQVFTYGLSVRQVPQHNRPGPLDPHFNPADVFDPAIEAEDRDPKLVLANVSKQTGLTFTNEKRKVRVLFVEKGDK